MSSQLLSMSLIQSFKRKIAVRYEFIIIFRQLDNTKLKYMYGPIKINFSSSGELDQVSEFGSFRIEYGKSRQTNILFSINP